MALSLGSALATKVYLGATEVSLAYLGATQVYTSSAFSAEAQDYFDRLDTAGDTTYTTYKQPLANYIDSLVTLGGAYWDDLESAASFVGVGIQGVTVPLKSTMPTLTNNNFVAGDLNQLTGLKGDASTKYLDTGALDNSTSQNDASLSVWVTDNVPLDNAYWIGSQRLAQRSSINNTVVKFSARTTSSSQVNPSPDIVDGFIGQTRTVGTDFDWFINTNSGNFVKASTTPPGTGISVFSYGAGFNKNASRIATYHYGPALNLATLEGLQDTLISEIAAVEAAAAAENYFARLVTAGDTTHTAYKTPITNYFTGLFQNNLWDKLESSALFVGVGIQGVTVPLKSTMTALTNNNFVAADLNTLTGLKGDASTKYIGTGIIDAGATQNDSSASCYVTSAATLTFDSYLGSSESGTGTFKLLVGGSNNTGFQCFNNTSNAGASTTPPTGLIGMSRSASASYTGRVDDTNNAFARTSETPQGQELFVFATNSGSPLRHTNARLATYHAGSALDLATLEGLQDTLITEIAAI